MAKMDSLTHVMDWVRAPGNSQGLDRDSSRDLLAAFDGVSEDLCAALDVACDASMDPFNAEAVHATPDSRSA